VKGCPGKHGIYSSKVSTADKEGQISFKPFSESRHRSCDNSLREVWSFHSMPQENPPLADDVTLTAYYGF
jgi:hypothetical protein